MTDQHPPLKSASRRNLIAALAGLIAIPYFFGKLREYVGPLVLGIPLFRSSKTPTPIPLAMFANERGDHLSFADFKGKHLLVNIWATWCPACREEMAALGRLRASLGPNFEPEVIALSVDAISFEQLRDFYGANGVNNLAVYRGDESEIMQAYGLPGIPTTLLIDDEGLEIARLVGPTTWDSEEIAAQLASLVTNQSTINKGL